MGRELTVARARSRRVSRPTIVVLLACLGVLSGYLPSIEAAAAAQGELVTVSVAPSGAAANQVSTGGTLSADGRYVVFQSNASNLVSGDTNARGDIFRFDRWTGELRAVSVTATGAFQAASHGPPVVSGDGRFVAFWSEGIFDPADVTRTPDVIVKDMDTGLLERLTVTQDGTAKVEVDRFSPNRLVAITDDARWVVFQSEVSNLVAGDVADGEPDLYVRDRLSATTTLLSTELGGLPGPSIGLDAVVAGAGTKAVVAYRVESGDRSQRMSVRHLEARTEQTVTPVDAKRLPFLAVAAGGASAIIPNGVDAVPNLYDVATGSSIPLPDNVDWDMMTASNFSSDLRFYVGPVPSAFTFRVVDLETDTVIDLPRGIDNAGPNLAAIPTSVSDDGTGVAFASAATNLVFGDTNGLADSFVVRVGQGTFADDDGNPFESDIEWLASEGITQGCALDLFCPKAPVTRGQMASFLVRSLDLPAITTDVFVDDAASPHQADINALAVAGITEGCGPNMFCPNDPVTRQQMASFLTRAMELPISTNDFFTDDDGSVHEGDINALASERVTLGCAPGRFCPTAEVLREQMAAFLHRAVAQ